MAGPQEEIFAPVAALLEEKLGIPSYFGENEFFEEHAAPRFVWLPTSATPAPSEITDDDETTNLTDVLATFEIYCHGETYDQAFGMVSPLLTAIKRTVRTPVSLAGWQTIGKESATEGEMLSVAIVIRLPIWEATFDGDGTYALATLEHVELDGSGDVDPDGILTGPTT